MPEYFRILRAGESLGEGVSKGFKVDLSAIAKQNSDNSPYCIPNELICGELGRMLGLPIPPIGLISSKPGKTALSAMVK